VTEKRIEHLSEDDLIIASIDAADLSYEMREHLDNCPTCSSEITRLETQMGKLGEIASRLSPSPKRKIVLEEKSFGSPQGSIRNWGLILKPAAAVAMVAIVAAWFFVFKVVPQQGVADLLQEMVEDERLMTEISLLEENPMVETFLEISTEGDSVLSEEFIDFINPFRDSEELSHFQIQGGKLLC
jgi:hypothetical protein